MENGKLKNCILVDTGGGGGGGEAVKYIAVHTLDHRFSKTTLNKSQSHPINLFFSRLLCVKSHPNAFFHGFFLLNYTLNAFFHGFFC